MEIIKIEGIVINSIKYGENSKILNVLTKDKGLLSIISKGCLSEKSKLRVVSNNFTYANFNIYYKKDKISTLINADVINHFINIKSDIVKYSYMNYLCDLSKNVYKESNNNEIYTILINSLLKIEENLNPKVLTNIVEIKYLNYLGVGLNLDGCSVCGNKFVTSISISKSGYLCAFHKGNEKVLDEELLKMYKYYYYIDISKITKINIKENIINEINKFLKIYYNDYTGLYLKTKNFLENVIN